MQISAMRFARIEGTGVTVQVDSLDDTKRALKELRHKRKEYRFLKKLLQRQEAAAAKREARAKAKRSKRKGVFGLMVSAGAGLAALVRRSATSKPKPELSAIRADLASADAILLNLDTCILQLEGRLASEG